MKYLSKILAIAATSLIALAQEKPADTNQATRPVPPSIRGPQRFDRAVLELTPEQRAKVEEINRNYGTNATPFFARLSTARRELETLVNVEKADEAAVRAKTKEMADLEADIALARA